MRRLWRFPEWERDEEIESVFERTVLTSGWREGKEDMAQDSSRARESEGKDFEWKVWQAFRVGGRSVILDRDRRRDE